MRYEIRARNNPLNDYVVVFDTDCKQRALRLLAMLTARLPDWVVWAYDTHELALLDETPVTDPL